MNQNIPDYEDQVKSRMTNFNKGIEIESVSLYLKAINDIKKHQEDLDTYPTKEWFFRGQENHSWKVEPSVFRNEMLNVEHLLMNSPLQKIPIEFRDMQDDFEIMTKYQHYGMCTRLLDVTTNPLVALYFACKSHGEGESPKTEASENEKNDKDEQAPCGMVYYKYADSVTDDSCDVKIISALSKLDLNNNGGENSLGDVFKRLEEKGIVNAEQIQKWLTDNDELEDFVKIIQSDYWVMPLYTNERLIRQSGAFLLPGKFNFIQEKKLEDSAILKGTDDLRDEFEDSFFYIKGCYKEKILDELNWYNINESSLFPELEHQLNYIRYINYKKITTSKTSPFSRSIKKEDMSCNQEVSCDLSEEAKKSYEENVRKFILEKVGDELCDEIFDTLKENMGIDWYGMESVISKLKMSIIPKIKNKVDNPKQVSVDIVQYMVDKYKELATDNNTGR